MVLRIQGTSPSIFPFHHSGGPPAGTSGAVLYSIRSHMPHSSFQAPPLSKQSSFASQPRAQNPSAKAARSAARIAPALTGPCIVSITEEGLAVCRDYRPGCMASMDSLLYSRLAVAAAQIIAVRLRAANARLATSTAAGSIRRLIPPAWARLSPVRRSINSWMPL